MSNSKRAVVLFLGIIIFAVSVLGMGYGGYVAYNHYYSTTAKVNRAINNFVATGYKQGATSASIDKLTSKTLQSTSDYKTFKDDLTHNNLPGANTKNTEVQVNNKGDVAGAAGNLKIKGQPGSIPFVAKAVKEDGQWKIEFFNIQINDPNAQ